MIILLFCLNYSYIYYYFETNNTCTYQTSFREWEQNFLYFFFIYVAEYLIYFFGLLTLESSYFSYLQQIDLKLVRHGEHSPRFSFWICLFLSLFFSILLLPINSLRFLFHLNTVIVWQLNIYCRDSLFWVRSNVFVLLYWCLGKSDCKLMSVEYIFASAWP